MQRVRVGVRWEAHQVQSCKRKHLHRFCPAEARLGGGVVRVGGDAGENVSKVGEGFNVMALAGEGWASGQGLPAIRQQFGQAVVWV